MVQYLGTDLFIYNAPYQIWICIHGANCDSGAAYPHRQVGGGGRGGANYHVLHKALLTTYFKGFHPGA